MKGADDPVTALLSFQLGCDQPAADQGAFTYPDSGGAPNALATEQGVWGAAEAAFPLGPVTFATAPVPCQPATTTTSTTTTRRRARPRAGRRGRRRTELHRD